MATATPAPSRTPLWRNVQVLRVAVQVGVVVAVVLGLRQLFLNLVDGLNETGISTSFDFLDQRTGFGVADSDFDPNSPSRDLFLVGVKNTFLTSIVGIGIASLLGLLVGVSRLSSNWLVAKLAAMYVESLRNIPPLVVIVFFNAALFRGITPIREAGTMGLPGLAGNALLFSNSTWGVPSFVGGGDLRLYWVALAVALGVSVGLWVWRTRLEIRTGTPSRRVLIAGGTLVGVAALGSLMLESFTVSFPSLDGNQVIGGFTFTTAYLAVTLALGLYTASHIAEIIRGSILAVHRGQNEAANALALTSLQRYRFVVLPQALRIAVPAIINQFLNLMKNTSLAVAVAYPELTNVTKGLIGNGKPAPQSILVMMAIYLSFSLTISLIVNLLNRRLQLVDR